MKHVLMALFSLMTLASNGSAEVIIKPVGTNDMHWDNCELVFLDDGKEIARQKMDTFGNAEPLAGVVPDGTAKAYYANGRVMRELPFSGNKINGTAFVYQPEGNLVMTIPYRDGRLNGEMIGVHGNTKIKTRTLWVHGKVQSSILYTEAGLKEQESIRQAEHKWLERGFHDNQALRSEALVVHSEDGLRKVTELKEYDKDGRLLVHATRRGSFDDCVVAAAKSSLQVGEPVDLEIRCACSDKGGCFTPDNLKPKLQSTNIWALNLLPLIVLRDSRGSEYQLCHQQFHPYTPGVSGAREWYHDNDAILKVRWPSPDLAFVPRSDVEKQGFGVSKGYSAAASR